MTGYTSLLPPRPTHIHKGDRGGVLIVGGCSMYRGAPILTARGALRSGCGLTVVFSDECVCSAVASSLPEAIVQSGLSTFSPQDILEILSMWSPRIHCLVLGPGIGRSPETGNIVRTVLEHGKKPMILDGDGIFWLAEQEGCSERRETLVLTPHEGEAERLLRAPSGSVHHDREKIARMIASRYGITLLKGPRTLVDDGIRCESFAEGNQALAIPGSGDVLSGTIAAFAAAGMPLFESACLGAFVHGRAGRFVSRKLGIDGVLASEVADALPLILRKMRMRERETKTS